MRSTSWKFLGGFAVLAGSTLALLIAGPLAPPDRSVTHPSGIGATAPRPVPPLPEPWPLSLAAGASRVVEGAFRPGDTFGNVLNQAGIPRRFIDQLAHAVESNFNVRRIRSGRAYKIYFTPDDQLLLFRYQRSEQQAVFVAKGTNGWRAIEITIPYNIRPRFVQAKILGSLEGALEATSMDRRGAIRLAHKLSEIFAWDIDFSADLRVNDSVDLVVEQRFLEGKFVGFGDVLSAELNIAGRIYRAIRYQQPGAPTAYFTPSGQSLQRAFLRSPVDFTSISSGFSHRRMHPILNIAKPHYGIDYVAPGGTPVRATATGTIVYVGRTGQAGNHVKIRHGGSYTSHYLHLSRFADGVKVGVPIEQGQVLGYVGRTGLATNNHLHYQLEQSGIFVDPLRINVPAGAPLADELMPDFIRQRDIWISILREGQIDRPLVLAGSSE